MIPFAYGDSLVRAVMIEDEVHFVGKDVCERLGYTNPNKAMADHCKGVTKRYPLQTPGGLQEVRVLSEPDVLRLIVRSKRPEAEAFERWVFEDVLPSIRKTGSYRIQSASAETDASDWFSRLSRVVHAWHSSGGEAAARKVWGDLAFNFPMPALDAVIGLMEAALGDNVRMRISGTSELRRVASRHNGALGGRPRKGETAGQARMRRLHLVEKEVIPSEDGSEATVITYSTQAGKIHGGTVA